MYFLRKKAKLSQYRLQRREIIERFFFWVCLIGLLTSLQNKCQTIDGLGVFMTTYMLFSGRYSFGLKDTAFYWNTTWPKDPNLQQPWKKAQQNWEKTTICLSKHLRDHLTTQPINQMYNYSVCWCKKNGQYTVWE